MLEVLGKASSINVRKVLWICAELHLPFTQVDYGTGFIPVMTPEFLAMNPNALVPVLKDGDFVLWESNAIIRYLANQYGATSNSAESGTAVANLYDFAPKYRARADQWIDWQAAHLNPSWSYAFLSLVRRSPAYQDPAALKAACESWTRHMAILDQRLQETGAFVAGEHFSLADIPIGLSVNRWFGTPFEKPEFEAVNRYFEKLKERDGFMKYGFNGLP